MAVREIAQAYPSVKLIEKTLDNACLQVSKNDHLQLIIRDYYYCYYYCYC